MVGSVDEIKSWGQVIIYMVHKKVGHLGIFVSSSVAKKEHKQILGSMGWLDYLSPGLYEMVIEDGTNRLGLDDYEVRFEEREMEDILQLDDGLKDEELFVAVNSISRFNDTIYRMYVSPWIRSTVDEPAAESLRQLHPLRVQRYMVSDENPFCWPLYRMAEQIVPERKIVDSDNPFVQLEKIFSDSIKNSLNFFADMRDLSQEVIFKSLYSTPWMKTFFGELEPSADKNVKKDEERIQEDNREKVRLRKEAGKGGFVEASVRVMLAMAGSTKALDIREFQAAEDIITTSKRLSRITPEKYKQLTKEQAKILTGAPRKALTSLSNMVTTVADKKKLYSIAEKMAHADTTFAENEGKLLSTLKQILFEKNK